MDVEESALLRDIGTSSLPDVSFLKKRYFEDPCDYMALQYCSSCKLRLNFFTQYDVGRLTVITRNPMNVSGHVSDRSLLYE